jgi:hypothetical protein
MQIDWSQAPEWANYVAMDKNGDWYWHQEKPQMLKDRFGYSNNQQFYKSTMRWRDSLQQRPEADK